MLINNVGALVVIKQSIIRLRELEKRTDESIKRNDLAKDKLKGEAEDVDIDFALNMTSQSLTELDREIKSFLHYYKILKVNYDVETEERDNLLEENGGLKAQVKLLTAENERLNKKIDEVTSNKEFNSNAEAVLKLVEDYAKQIAVGINMKKEGRPEINTADIVKDYKYAKEHPEEKITLGKIGEKYGMSGNAIKKRLERVGVYEGAYENYKGETVEDTSSVSE